MIHFNVKLLITRKQKINIKKETKLSDFLFTYQSQGSKTVSYEQYSVDLQMIDECKVTEYVTKHFENMLSNFNKTLRPGEKPRKLLKVYRVETETITNLIPLKK